MDQTAEARGTAAPTLAVRLLVGLIAFYRFFLSPLIGQQCRFTPTCSLYAREALLRHGALRGSRLALTRIGRCHPWADGGLDPVPPPRAGTPPLHQTDDIP